MVETVVRVEFKDCEIRFTIKSNKELDYETVKSIKKASFQVYWCDMTSKHFSFDTKLSNGTWLENINYNNELTKAEALILN